MILELRRVMGAALFRRCYRAAEAALFIIAGAGFLVGVMALAFWILEYSKRNGLS